MSLPRYERYKETGVEWLGEVPEDWRVLRVSTVASVINGYPFDSACFDPADGVSLVRIRDLGQVETETRYNGDIPADAPIVTSDDVLVGMDGDFNVGRWHGTGTAVLNQRTCCVRGESNEITRLIEYALSAPLKRINDVTYATTVKHLSSSQIEKVKLAFPVDSHELSALLVFLDRETAKIDVLIEEQRRLIALLKEKQQAFIAHVVTKGLGPPAQMKDSGIEWIRQVPEHWSIARTRMLFDERDQRSTSGDEEMLTVSHITGVTRRSEKTVYMFEAETNEGYKLCQAGDLVINTLWGWMGAMGTAPEDGMVSPAYNVYEPNGRLIPDFIDPLVRTRAFVNEITRYSKGVWSSRLRIYPAEFFLIYMPVPPIEEQRAIAAAISKLNAETEQLSNEAERGIALLQERRSALISAAVTGKINVTTQVPKPVRSTWNAGFARQVLAAETLSRCNGPRMGRIKLQKLIHLCEYHAQLDEVRGAYSRQAAGPFAPQVMEDVREGLFQQRWFEEYKDESRYAYRALEKAGGHKQYLPHWEDKQAKIDQVLNLLGDALTRTCEIASTLYAAWNDLLIEGKSPTDAEIIHEASSAERWHESKEKIATEKWPEALKWMRANGLVPGGYGTHTTHQPDLFTREGHEPA